MVFQGGGNLQVLLKWKIINLFVFIRLLSIFAVHCHVDTTAVLFCLVGFDDAKCVDDDNREDDDDDDHEDVDDDDDDGQDPSENVDTISNFSVWLDRIESFDDDAKDVDGDYDHEY